MANVSNNGNGNGQAIQRTPGAKGTLLDLIASKRESFAAVLPQHMKIERFLKIAHAAMTRTPQLLNCTPASVIMALVSCSELGLEPNSPLGHAYLIPYGKECTLVIGYRGLLALMRRSGELASIDNHVVYDGDVFEVHFGDDAKIVHVPNLKGQRGDKVIAAYMIARLKDGSIQREVMTIDEIEKIRARSRSGNAGPWKTDYAEMCRKTVLRRGAKRMPLSTEMARAVELEEHEEARHANGAIDVDIITTPSAHAPSASSKVAQIGAEAEQMIAELADLDGEGLIAWNDTNKGRADSLSPMDWQAVNDAWTARMDVVGGGTSGGPQL